MTAIYCHLTRSIGIGDDNCRDGVVTVLSQLAERRDTWSASKGRSLNSPAMSRHHTTLSFHEAFRQFELKAFGSLTFIEHQLDVAALGDQLGDQ